MANYGPDNPYQGFGKSLVDASGNMNWKGSLISKGISTVGSFIKEPPGYSGTYGSLQKGMDSAYDAIADGIAMVPGWGTAASLIMKGAGVLNKGLQRVGGGTDGMTKTDAILNSNFLGLTPLGMINGFGGKKAKEYKRDNELDAASGAGFGGFQSLQNTTMIGAGKKYGAFSQGARRKQDALTEYTQGVKHTISGIVDFNTLNNLASQGTTPFTVQQQNIDLSGGIQQLRAAAKGMKFKPIKPIKFKQKYYDPFKATLGEDWNEVYDPEGVQTAIPAVLSAAQKQGIAPIPTKRGGIVYMGTDGKLQDKPRSGSLFAKNGVKFAKKTAKKYKSEYKIKDVEPVEDRNIEQLIEYVKQMPSKPEFIERMNNEPITVQFVDSRNPDETLYGTHYMANSGNRVYPSIFPINGKMTYIDNPDEAYDYADKTGNYIEFNSPEEAANFAENYKQGWPQFFNSYDGQQYLKWYIDKQFKTDSFKSGGKTEYRGIKETSTGQTIGIPINLTNAQKGGQEPIKTNSGRQVIMMQDGTVIYVEAARQMRPFLKNGGQMNVIPEGALHARKNHLTDVDDMYKEVTHKGIPVISIEEGDIIQHAEVEHSEIIFTKKVTDKIEKYRKQGTEEAAIECGKLLVQEILYNTDDRTGLIQTIE